MEGGGFIEFGMGNGEVGKKDKVPSMGSMFMLELMVDGGRYKELIDFRCQHFCFSVLTPDT